MNTRPTLTATLLALLTVAALGVTAAAASAAPIERGQDRFAFDATDNFLCGFDLDRHVDFQGNWIVTFEPDGDARMWHGTVNVTVELTNPDNGRTITMRFRGIDREVYLTESTVVVTASGPGHWTQLPGVGTLSGYAGHSVMVDTDGTITSFEFHGLSVTDGDAALCDYLAGS